MTSTLWKHMKFVFTEPSHSQYLQYFQKFGKHLQSVEICLDQSKEENRINACEVLDELTKQKERRLQKLKLVFTQENPLFYAGKEFVDRLKVLFGPVDENTKVIKQLMHVDLSGLTAMFDDVLFDTLAKNSPALKTLNIQNRVLVCKVTPECIFNMIHRCPDLTELHVHMLSISEDGLLAFTENHRRPLQHLSLYCRRETKYMYEKSITDDAWQIVSKKLPNLKVTLIFDHTCPLHKVNEIMLPSVPVFALRLETFTYIYEEVRKAARYYSSSLEKLVLETPLNRNSPELNQALVELASECKSLKSLHVFCVLDQDTVDKILSLRPQIKEKQTYTLKYTKEPHPWVAGRDCLT